MPEHGPRRGSGALACLLRSRRHGCGQWRRQPNLVHLFLSRQPTFHRDALQCLADPDDGATFAVIKMQTSQGARRCDLSASSGLAGPRCLPVSPTSKGWVPTHELKQLG